ncbi:hypothetical protein QQF64_007696 [Cirrhinus molitorella]|uniref:Uncharacterized protein n=1 Tax=Cirrhinus molitorella TaxID=172907 RepID=A0ABR3MBI0_9TELE
MKSAVVKKLNFETCFFRSSIETHLRSTRSECRGSAGVISQLSRHGRGESALRAPLLGSPDKLLWMLNKEMGMQTRASSATFRTSFALGRGLPGRYHWNPPPPGRLTSLRS